MNNRDVLAGWATRHGVLATMHGKETTISPIIKASLGISLSVPDKFNTDHFGTFTRDIARAGDQLSAARSKALAALALTGYDLAIASEGSFGVHPLVPYCAANLELVLLIDSSNDCEVVGHYRSSEHLARSEVVSTVSGAVAKALAWGFPTQGVIIRRSPHSQSDIYKDIDTITEFENIASALLSRWSTTQICIETDMRAHRCPSRRELIRKATDDLVKNCRSVCPECGLPGFVVTRVERGLPCRCCGQPTDMIRIHISRCRGCMAELITNTPEEFADPGECAHCNP